MNFKISRFVSSWKILNKETCVKKNRFAQKIPPKIYNKNKFYFIEKFMNISKYYSLVYKKYIFSGIKMKVCLSFLKKIILLTSLRK